MARSDPTWITDSTALRALAHPLRWQLVQLFDLEPTMTATRCAELTGESVGTCSYHLNTLARYGFIEPASASNGREKPWRSASHDISWRAGGEGLDDEGAMAAVALSDVAMDDLAGQLKAWFRRRSREAPEWADATGLSEAVAYVTPEELADLTRELRELANRFDERARDASKRPPGARPARIITSTSLRRSAEEDGSGA
ncbi:winged helix-turn-helix domain-containing protein [Pseudonocardia endophytica]|uniref:Helix-turn-helix protein n=1 Tax=Pseudonocardia endophytica TaxID=401976 RepID=A0A4R1HZG8_PSEEN|nr:helix-turn-helix domain-containing protein [Pseudonocardia endophytica]TCK26983.1 helix-turn-helix protein [Pseudonocardia endophytica]